MSSAPTAIYTLSLHDALPIWRGQHDHEVRDLRDLGDAAHRYRGRRELVGLLVGQLHVARHEADRKSTRLNSSHPSISYAVFCLKKKRLVARPAPVRERLVVRP